MYFNFTELFLQMKTYKKYQLAYYLWGLTVETSFQRKEELQNLHAWVKDYNIAKHFSQGPLRVNFLALCGIVCTSFAEFIALVSWTGIWYKLAVGSDVFLRNFKGSWLVV